MTDRQSDIARWTAGFFDGDGTIAPNVGEKDCYSIGYGISPSCNIRHNHHAGFFDAEGCILTSVREDSDRGIDYGITAKCQIGHNKCSSPIVDLLCGFADALGVDYSVYDSQTHTDEYPDQFRFVVSTQDGVEKYLRELYPYLIVKQKQAEIMLEEVLPLLKRGEHTNRRGFLKVMKHVDRMNELKGGTRGKYNLDYFESEWGMTLDG